MSKSIALLVGALVAAALVGPAGAADTSSPPGAPSAAAPASQPAKPAATRPHHFAGQVVSVNADARTLTVQKTGKRKPRELTFAVDPGAASALANLKAGDQVKVSYVQRGGQTTATAVVKHERTAEK